MRARRPELAVTPGGALLVAAALFFLDDETLISLVAAAFFHEAGHLFALAVLGVGVARVRLTLTGAEIVLAEEAVSYADEIVCALAGPAFGAAAAFLFSAFGFYTAAGVSAALTVFNLLPVWPLDGGRALLALGRLALGQERGEKVCFFASLAAAVSLAAAGLLLRWGALPIIFGLWLACRTCKNLADDVK